MKDIGGYVTAVTCLLVCALVHHINNGWDTLRIGDLLQIAATLALPFLFYQVIQKPNNHVRFYLDEMEQIKQELLGLQKTVASLQITNEDDVLLERFNQRAEVLLACVSRYTTLSQLAENQGFAVALQELNILIRGISRYVTTLELPEDIANEESRKTFIRSLHREVNEILLNHHSAVCTLQGIRS